MRKVFAALLENGRVLDGDQLQRSHGLVTKVKNVGNNILAESVPQVEDCSGEEDDPSEHIRALVSGIADPDRKLRYVSVAQTWVDDSGSGGDSRYYVLGGFKATVKTWEDFVLDWKATLDAPRSIKYFKSAEAESLKEQFRGFSEQERNQKLAALISVIERYPLFGISCATPQRDYDEIIKPYVTEDFDSPYLINFSYIVMHQGTHEFTYGDFASASQQIWTPNRDENQVRKVDFIFDNQENEEKPAKRHYEVLRKIEPYSRRVGNIDYRDDKIFLPLQAADLIAWQRRRRLCANEGERVEHKRLHSNPLRFHAMTLQRSDLLMFLDRIKAQRSNP